MYIYIYVYAYAFWWHPGLRWLHALRRLLKCWWSEEFRRLQGFHRFRWPLWLQRFSGLLRFRCFFYFREFSSILRLSMILIISIYSKTSGFLRFRKFQWFRKNSSNFQKNNYFEDLVVGGTLSGCIDDKPPCKNVVMKVYVYMYIHTHCRWRLTVKTAFHMLLI